MASLPKRPIYGEPGSIELPRTVFNWLLAEVIRDGASWGVTEVGLLATILFSFENQTPIIKGAGLRPRRQWGSEGAVEPRRAPPRRLAGG